MKLPPILNEVVEFVKKEDHPYIFDIRLKNMEDLKRYSSLEAHFVIYPYHRNINSKDIFFIPYEEYVDDILTCHKSAYYPARGIMDKLFGLFLGLIIILVFLLFKPDVLYSVESLVSVLGAYFVGKEIWYELEKVLIDLTIKLPVRYIERYYFYRLEKHTTLTNYSYFAKEQRYGCRAVLPDHMDFIQQSNSQTVRMLFSLKDIPECAGQSAHVLSIQVKPELLSKFEKAGFMFGVKISLNRSFLGFNWCREAFQSLSRDSRGCLDTKGEWINNAVFCRRTARIGRIKFFLGKSVVRDFKLIQ